MKICENGMFRELTPQEIAAVESQSRLDDIAERRRPMTEQEVSRLMITQSINTLAVDDSTALRMKDFYPEWAEGVSYEPGFKVCRKGKLWRVRQAHTSLTGWEPENTPALWEQINEVYEGTVDDPIPYEGNMALEQGKYYIQDNVIYLCSRDTGIPVYQPLCELVGLYVKEV
jgi:hypothetical protein